MNDIHISIVLKCLLMMNHNLSNHQHDSKMKIFKFVTINENQFWNLNEISELIGLEFMQVNLNRKFEK